MDLCTDLFKMLMMIHLYFFREARMDPRFWRNLGYIPGKIMDLVPITRHFQSRLAETRLNDWHFVLNHILQELKEVQRNRFLHWSFSGQPCQLRVPIMFIIGDIEGHDKLCTRKSGHTSMMPGVTHSCNIQRDSCSDLEAPCHLFTKDEITSLQREYQDWTRTSQERKETKAELDQLGFYSNVQNAIANADFGNSPFGIHGACAICLLHTHKQRFPGDAFDLYISLFGNSRSTSGVNTLDRSIPRLINHCDRQSDRTLPSLKSFKVSFLKPKYTLSANEKLGRIFALLLFSMTTYGWHHAVNPKRKVNGDNEMAIKVIKLIQYTISIYRYLYQDNFPRSNILYDNTAVKDFLTLYKELSQWYEDEDDSNYTDFCTFPKFHYIKHVEGMVHRFGSSRNFDGGPAERNHKYITKSPGSRSQGRIDMFDQQTAKNLCSKIVLDRVFKSQNLKTSYGSGSIRMNDRNDFHEDMENGEDGTNTIKKHPVSSTFELLRTDDSIEPKWNANRAKKGKEQPLFKQDVLDFVARSIPGVQNIKGFTCLYWNGEIIRSHPNYKRREWYDWVNLKWTVERTGEEYICPAKVYMFLDLKNIPGEDFTDGYWAVVHSTFMNERNMKPDNDALKVWKKRGKSPLFKYWTMEEELRLVKVSSFSSVVFVYQDFENLDMTTPTKFVIEVSTMTGWDTVHNI